MPPRSVTATPRISPAVSDASDSSAYAKRKHDSTSDAEMEDVMTAPMPALLDVPKKKKARKSTSDMITAPTSIDPVTPVRQGAHSDPKSPSTADIARTQPRRDGDVFIIEPPSIAPNADEWLDLLPNKREFPVPIYDDHIDIYRG